MSSVVTWILWWKNSNVVDHNFELVVVKVFNELVIVVFEFLETVIVVKKLVHAAVLAVK